MRIEELTAGVGVTFYINIPLSQQMVFESSITEVNLKKHLILAQAIIKNEKVLSFRGNGITIDLVAALPDDKPVLFKNIFVETLKLGENEYCYNIACAHEGTPYNRREAFRCFVGLPTVMRGGKDMNDHQVIIKDVSATGFALTTGTDVTLEPGQLVHILLEDYIEEINHNYSFHLYGIMVRKQELEQGKTVYGFRLNNHVGGLENYLTQKERIRIKKNRGR